MTINISMPERHRELKPRITVVGVGGAGGNAVNNMIRSNLSGVEFLVANTDAQALETSQAECRIQLGLGLTHGLGAGARPDIGRAAAEEVLDEILEHLGGSNMVFITAGMGGGTGTGAAPVIARAAREHGILTVGVVTKPFHFEGAHRMRTAEHGIEELSKFVDTLIIIPNQNLFRVANEKTTFAQAFQLADDVLYSGVRGVTDLMVMPGLINLDFADIRTVMSEMGKAMMGTGETSGERRATDAAEAAISNPLLDDMSMRGARGILINITGGLDMSLFEVDEAANRIRDEVDPDGNIIFGATFDERLEGVMRVSVVATGIDAQPDLLHRPQDHDSRVTPFPGRPAGPAPGLKEAAVGEHEAAPAKVAVGGGAAPADTDVGAVADSAADHASATTRQAEADSRPGAHFTVQASMLRRPITGATWGTPAPTAFGGTDPEPAQGQSADRPFVAPRPMLPTDRAEPEPRVARVEEASGPVAEQRKRLRFPSLLERVTGAGRGRTEPAPAPAPARAPAPATARASEHHAERQAEVSPQKQLGGLDPADRLAISKQEEDLLDIPAFLR